jgi:hypothetical protein
MTNVLSTDAELSSTDPEPEAGTLVRCRHGWLWLRLDDPGDRRWLPVEDDGEPDPARSIESWTAVAGNCGPVIVIENHFLAASDAELARQTAHTAADWAKARARLGGYFDDTYQHVARIAVTSLHNSVARTADDVAAVLGLPRPKGWRP